MTPNAVLLASFAALALYLYGQDQEGGIVETIGGYVESMLTDEQAALQDQNVQAFLMLIRTGEGTANAAGYNTLFGGRRFDSFADHPRIKITAGGYTSTAAGAYQILESTWDGLGLPDFSPMNQDIAAVKLIARRGALADVIAGRFDRAIRKCNKEWASLPGSPYGQPTLTMNRAYAVLQQWGGQFQDATV